MLHKTANHIVPAGLCPRRNNHLAGEDATASVIGIGAAGAERRGGDFLTDEEFAAFDMASRIEIKEADLRYEFLGKLLAKGAQFKGAVAEVKESMTKSAPVEKTSKAIHMRVEHPLVRSIWLQDP